MARGRPRCFDPDQALEAALQVFWEEGYEGAGLDAISERSGVGKQSLYNTFGDKRALFGRVVERYARASEEEWTALLGEPGGLAGLRRFLERWTSCPSELEGRGCLMVGSIHRMASEDPELRELADEHLELQRSRIAAAFRRAVDAGELPGDLEPDACAARWLALVLGMAAFAKLPGAAGRIGDVVRAERAWLEAQAARARR